MKRIMRNKLAVILTFFVLITFFLFIAFVFVIIRLPIGKTDQNTLTGKYKGYFYVFPKISDRLKYGIYNDGYHFLELKDNGTFEYVYTPLDGEKTICEGNWALYKNSWKTQIIFRKIDMSKLSEFPGEKKKRMGIYYAYIKRLPGRIVGISIDADVSFYLIKE